MRWGGVRKVWERDNNAQIRSSIQLETVLAVLVSLCFMSWLADLEENQCDRTEDSLCDKGLIVQHPNRNTNEKWARL